MNRKAKIIHLIILLISLHGVGVLAQLGSPDSRKESIPIIKQIDTQPKKTQQPANPNKQEGSLEITSIGQENTNAPQTAPDNHANKEDVKTISQDKIERYTKWLVVAAFCQLGTFIAQLIAMGIQTRRLRETVIATQKAAEAAELNARAAIGIELPILRAIPPDLVSTDKLIGEAESYGGSVNDGPPTKYSAVGLISFENHGRTPAFPEKLAVGWMVVEKLPDNPTYIRTSTLNHASVIKPSEVFIADTHYGIELTDEDLKAIEKGTAWLWFYGGIHYRDFLNSKREARFCWRFANRNFDNVFCFFSSDGEPPAQYTKNT